MPWGRKRESFVRPSGEPVSIDFQPFEKPVKVPTKHIIPMEDITINKQLGMGEFGVVQQGVWTNDNHRIQVAIKCLTREKMTSNSAEFLKEAAVMHTIDHYNIVRLYGVVLHMDSLMLVTELAPLRSLLECVKDIELRSHFPVTTLCDFAEQICDGMAYLENKRLIHRDLAARNILVFSKTKVKISDFGLSRALGIGKDYYQTNYNTNLKLPVAWCAPECITYLRFTSASDVWAYGVCLWEMFSYGFQPWVALSGHEIIEAIDAPKFKRLERPMCCPESYYQMMLHCWSHKPSERPMFKTLSSRLREIRPEQVRASSPNPSIEIKDDDSGNMLEFDPDHVITVIGKESLTGSSLWFGVLPGGACGYFDPEQTKPLGQSTQDALFPWRSPGGFEAKSNGSSWPLYRPVNRGMISAPWGDVKHTTHVGLNGSYFGDLSFLDPACCARPHPKADGLSHRPPGEQDPEQMPLINPNSPSHLTGGAPSSTPPYPTHNPARSSASSGTRDEVDHTTISHASHSKPHRSALRFFTTNPAANLFSKVKSATLGRSLKNDDGSKPSTSRSKPEEEPHEYHEISDTVMASKSTTWAGDALSKSHTLGKSVKKKATIPGSMKAMTAHEQKTLETAVAMANTITTKSMNDLDQGSTKVSTSGSEAYKFHFKFPYLGHHQHRAGATTHEQDPESQGKQERRNFSEEAQRVPDIQATLTEECKMAYASLIEQPIPNSSLMCQITDKTATLCSPRTSMRPAADSAYINRSAPRIGSRLASSHEGREVTTINGEDGCSYDTNKEAPNPLPLPPKPERTPVVYQTRHVRKHPLVTNAQQSLEQRLKDVGRLSHIEDGREKGLLNLPDKTSNVYQNLSYQQTLKNEPRQASEVLYQNMEIGVDVYDGVQRRHTTTHRSGVEENTENSSNNNPFSSINVESVNPFVGLEQKIVLRTNVVENLRAAETFATSGATGGAEGTAASYGEGLLKESPDHVSVEDLLEFAGQKPCGRQRGSESDEVRIMRKVFKPEEASEQDCFDALELTDWEVHTAIKVLQLHISTGKNVFACSQKVLADKEGLGGTSPNMQHIPEEK